MKVVWFFILIFVCAANISVAQTIQTQVINSSGIFYIGNNITVEASVGETIVPTVSNSSVILTQGLLQVEVDLVNSIKTSTVNTIKYFPNPVQNNLHFDLGNYNGEFTAVIYNASGAIVCSTKISAIHRSISCANWSAGNYCIRIFNNTFSQSFIISKL